MSKQRRAPGDIVPDQQRITPPGPTIERATVDTAEQKKVDLLGDQIAAWNKEPELLRQLEAFQKPMEARSYVIARVMGEEALRLYPSQLVCSWLLWSVCRAFSSVGAAILRSLGRER